MTSPADVVDDLSLEVLEEGARSAGGPVLSLPPHPVFDALERSEVFRLSAETTPDEVRTKLLALREHLTGADPLTVALTREHVLRLLRELGYADAATLLTATLGRPDAARWHGAGPGADALRPAVMTLAEVLTHPEMLRPPLVVVPRLAWSGRISLLAGREKMGGKSTTLTAGAAAVTRGSAFLDGRAPLGTVLWYSADVEAPYDIAMRFERFGGDPSRFLLVTSRPASFTGLYALILEYRPTLLVIDTLGPAVAGDVTDAASADQWLPLLHKLREVAQATDTAVSLVHHANKGTGTYRDSTAIGAAVDAILEVSESTEAPTVRNIKARARWAMPDFAVRLEDDRLTLDAGEPSLDARVYHCIVAEPGISGNKVCDKLDGRREDVLACLKRLAADGAVGNLGTRTHPAWHPKPAVVPVVPSGSGTSQLVSGSRFPLRGTGTTTPVPAASESAGNQLEAL